MRRAVLVVLVACGGFDDGPATRGRVSTAEGCTEIETGADTDGNATLGDDEVTATSRLCGKPASTCGGGKSLTGPVVIRASADWDQLTDVTCIDGDLLIVGTSDPELQAVSATITGNVVVAGNPYFTTLAGLARARIGGTLLVQGNDALAELTGAAIPQLASLQVIANRHLPDVTGLDGHTCIGALTVRGNAHLANVEALDHLASAGAIDYEANPAELRLPALMTTGSLRVADVGQQRLALPSLASAGAVTIEHDQVLATIDLPQLETASRLRIADDPSLAAMRTALSSVTDVELVRLPALATLLLGGPQALGGSLIVEDTALPDLAPFTSIARIHHDLVLHGFRHDEAKTFAQRVEIDGETTID
jgi:hypothetical protein